MKALTVQQPWAWAIVAGLKLVENRSSAWHYRGPLAIHAGCRWSARGGAHPLVRDAIRPWLAAHELGRPVDSALHPDLFRFGAVIGVCELLDAHEAQVGCCESPWAEESYLEAGGRVRRQVTHLVLADPRPVVPVPARGRLGLWDTGDLELVPLEV